MNINNRKKSYDLLADDKGVNLLLSSIKRRL